MESLRAAATRAAVRSPASGFDGATSSVIARACRALPTVIYREQEGSVGALLDRPHERSAAGSLDLPPAAYPVVVVWWDDSSMDRWRRALTRSDRIAGRPGLPIVSLDDALRDLVHVASAEMGSDDAIEHGSLRSRKERRSVRSPDSSDEHGIADLAIPTALGRAAFP
jgi:hypothetical protein